MMSMLDPARLMTRTLMLTESASMKMVSR